MTTRSIGARIPRNEDPRLLQGLGCFVDDVNPPGVLHGAAKLTQSDCKLPAVAAVPARPVQFDREPLKKPRAVALQGPMRMNASVAK